MYLSRGERKRIIHPHSHSFGRSRARERVTGNLYESRYSPGVIANRGRYISQTQREKYDVRIRRETRGARRGSFLAAGAARERTLSSAVDSPCRSFQIARRFAFSDGQNGPFPAPPSPARVNARKNPLKCTSQMGARYICTSGARKLYFTREGRDMGCVM